MRTATLLFIVFSCRLNAFGCDSFRPDESITLRTKRSSEINQKMNFTWTEKLKKHLFLNYDKFERPTGNGNAVKVDVNIFIKHIDMDEEKSIMTIHSWLQLMWQDEKLKWNASEYGDLHVLHLYVSDIWQPHIYAFNSVLGSAPEHFGTTNCAVKENGSVFWIPPTIYQVYCTMDMKHWPFDTQVCSLVLRSWSYNENEIDLTPSSSEEEMEKHIFIGNSGWKFLNVKIKKNYHPCCPDSYSDITYDLTIQRESLTYTAILFTPASAIIIMALAIFLIPPTSMDKITLAVTTIIINCLFLLYFTQKLPILAGRTPLIVLFYSRTLYLLSCALIISVTVINIAKNPKISPLPWTIKKLLTGSLGKWLFIGITCKLQDSTKSMAIGSDNVPVLSEPEKHDVECSNYETFQQEWISFAAAIDRLAFLIYCLIFIVLGVSYFV